MPLAVLGHSENEHLTYLCNRDKMESDALDVLAWIAFSGLDQLIIRINDKFSYSGTFLKLYEFDRFASVKFLTVVIIPAPSSDYIVTFLRRNDPELLDFYNNVISLRQEYGVCNEDETWINTAIGILHDKTLDNAVDAICNQYLAYIRDIGI
jgi:hypothetical protein